MMNDTKFNMNHPDNWAYIPEVNCGNSHNGCHPAYNYAMKGLFNQLLDAYSNNLPSQDKMSGYSSGAILKARQNSGDPITGAGRIDLKTGDWESVFGAIF